MKKSLEEFLNAAITHPIFCPVCNYINVTIYSTVVRAVKFIEQGNHELIPLLDDLFINIVSDDSNSKSLIEKIEKGVA
jgi:hypothetical protein